MKWLLLVEKNTLLRQSLALLLERQTGLGCIQTGSLDEALHTLNDMKDEPACVIVDLEQPDEGGAKLSRQLRRLPVLALVPGQGLEHRSRALEAGVDEVVPTVESVDRVIEAVRRLAD